MNAIRSLYGDFGMRMRQHRKSRALTQEQLAGEIALSRTSVANIEAGRQTVLLHQVIDIARALSVRPSELLPADDRVVQMDTVDLTDAELPEDVKKFLDTLNAEGQPTGGQS